MMWRAVLIGLLVAISVPNARGQAASSNVLYGCLQRVNHDPEGRLAACDQVLADLDRGRSLFLFSPRDNERAAALAARAEALVELGREKAARRDMARALELDPKVPHPAGLLAALRLDRPARSRATRPSSPPPQPDGDTRVALVIGNGAYQSAPELLNPSADAEGVAAVLRRIGFRVLIGIDLERRAMAGLIAEFASAADDADVAVAYYAGHGIQVDDTNYLIPIDGTVRSAADLNSLIALPALIADTGDAQDLSVVIVDACRDNPLVGEAARALGPGRSVMPGLSPPLQVPDRTLIAFATAEHSVAADGTGRHSPFTQALLHHLPRPGLELRRLFTMVRDEVVVATGAEQVPKIWTELGRAPVYLVPPAPPGPSRVAQPGRG